MVHMKKICPYCGRIDALGFPCKGCGYILQRSDNDAPKDSSEQNPFPPQSTDTYIAFNAKQTETMSPDIPSKFIPKDKKNTVNINYTKSASVILGSIIFVYGAYGLIKTMRFYFIGDILNGIVGNAFAIAMIICGLSCIRPLGAKYRKFMKYILIISLVISFGIPLLLMINNFI